MNKTVTHRMLGTLAVAGSLLATSAIAHERPQAHDGYVGDSSKGVVVDSSGNCVHNAFTSKDVPCVPPVAEEKPEPAPAPVAPPPPPAPEKISLSAGALFDFDKAVLKPAGMQELDQVVAKIKAGPVSQERITVTGHTDSVGSDAYNQKLSERRAQAVTDYLVSQGVDAASITTQGMGESQPVAGNETAEGRAQNRRVDVEIAIVR